MKKWNLYCIMSLAVGIFPLQAASQPQQNTSVGAASQAHHQSKSAQANNEDDEDDDYDDEDEYYDILERDQIDTTSTLAVPFDDSEVEDEEEINRAERKNVFKLPHSR